MELIATKTDQPTLVTCRVSRLSGQLQPFARLCQVDTLGSVLNDDGRRLQWRRHRRSRGSSRSPLASGRGSKHIFLLPLKFGRPLLAKKHRRLEVFTGQIFSSHSNPPRKVGSKSSPPQIPKLMGNPSQSISK